MKFCVLALCMFLAIVAHSQDYLTRNGSITFFSHTPLEDIKATNNEVVSLLNTASGSLEFKIAIKSFHFSKQAMEDHFNNSDYMDSQKYPKAGFSGKITNLADVQFSKDGTYNVTVEGNLTIKDVTKPVTARGTISVKDGKVTAKAGFSVNRKAYNVIGESFTQKKLADEIQVTVDCVYDKR